MIVHIKTGTYMMISGIIWTVNPFNINLNEEAGAITKTK